MLNWLFRSRIPVDPPTDKQLRYARHLGVSIPKKIDKKSMSAILRTAELLQKYGQAKLDEESKWQSLVEAEKWMLVVFTRGQSKLAEIARINGAELSNSGEIKIEIELMKVGKDKHIGTFIDVGKYLEISLDSIHWYEVINEVDMHDLPRFNKYQDRLRKKSSNLR
jgi:hypothetical protein